MKHLILGICALFIFAACGEIEENQTEPHIDDIFTEQNNKNIDLIYDSYSETLENDSEPLVLQRSNWGLKNLKTILGLGLGGEIGSLAWGGSRSVELIWRRKKNSQINETFEDLTSNDIQFDDFSTEADIDSQVEPIVNSLIRSQRVKDPIELRKNLRKVTKDFLEMSKALSVDPNLTWSPYKLRLDVNVGLSGKVSSGLIVKAGFDTRVRLEWIKNPSAQYLALNRLDEDNPILEKVREMITVMSVDLEAAVNSHSRIKNFRAKVFRVGIGIGAKGNVGAYTGKSEIVPYVYFKKKSPSLNHTFADSFETKSMNSIKFIRAQVDDQVLQIDRKRLRKGLKKAFKFGYKMGSKLNKKKYKNRSWEVKTMKVGYKFSLSGDVESVNVKATPNFEIEYEKM